MAETGEGAFDRGEPLGGAQQGWFSKLVLSRVNVGALQLVTVSYAAFDQILQQGSGACSCICVLAAAWLLEEAGRRLTSSAMDMLTYRGCEAWRKQCRAAGARSFGANRFFNLEFALASLPQLEVDQGDDQLALTARLGAPTGDEQSLAAVMQRLLIGGVYIVAAQQHFVLLHWADQEEVYFFNSLGAMLDEQCKATHLLRFDSIAAAAAYLVDVHFAAPAAAPAPNRRERVSEQQLMISQQVSITRMCLSGPLPPEQLQPMSAAEKAMAHAITQQAPAEE